MPLSVGWHHRLNGQGFGWTPGVGDGQGDLVWCSSWSCRESDMTERLNWTELTLLHLLKLWIPLTTAFWDCCSVAMLCPTLCNCMDYSLPGFSVLQLSPGVCSNSCPLSKWCHPTISSSVVPFSSCLQSFPASGSSLMSWLFASGGESIGASVSASVLPMISFRMDWFDLLAILGTQESSPAGVGCHVLLQGIFPTQELNPGLLHCRQILYHPSHEERNSLTWYYM